MNLINNSLSNYAMNYLRGYNHQKYWRRRAVVVDPSNKTNILLKLYYLFYIKKADAKNNCSFGTNLNSGSVFLSPPNLPHGPNGIIIGHDLKFGRNVTIYHQVTVAHGGGIIGDNVMLGAGSKILSKVCVGNNAKVGMNSVVIENIPDNATVVLTKPRIILNKL